MMFPGTTVVLNISLILYPFEKCFILYVVCDEYIMCNIICKNSRKKTEFPIRPKFD